MKKKIVFAVLVLTVLCFGKDKEKLELPPIVSDAKMIALLEADNAYWRAVAQAIPFDIQANEAKQIVKDRLKDINDDLDPAKWRFDETTLKPVPVPPVPPAPVQQPQQQPKK